MVYECCVTVNEFFHANPSFFLKNSVCKIQKSAKVGRYACPAFALSDIDIIIPFESDSAAASGFFVFTVICFYTQYSICFEICQGFLYGAISCA